MAFTKEKILDLTNNFADCDSSCFGRQTEELEIEKHHFMSTPEEVLRQGSTIRNADPNLIGFAGVDIRVGNEMYVSDTLFTRVNGEFGLVTLASEKKVKEVKKNRELVIMPNKSGNLVYYTTSLETFKLRNGITLRVDSRSTSGRLALMVDALNVDQINLGNERAIVCAVRSYAFPLKITPIIDSLISAVFRHRNSSYLSYKQVKSLENEGKVALYRNGDKIEIKESNFGEHGMELTYQTHRVLRAKSLSELNKKGLGPINFGANRQYNVEDYFDVIEGNGNIVLEPRRFYLLGTRERIAIKGIQGVISREDPKSINGVWGHFAGEINPGYDGELTMEVYSQSKVEIREGQCAGFVQFDKLEGHPRDAAFTREYSGPYQGHKAPMAPRQFKKIAL